MEKVTKCNSLEEIRTHIDEIDHQIVELIVRRGAYVSQAASFKKSTDGVKAPQRVEQVIHKVREIADDAGGNPQIIENVYRTMISAFISEELSEYNR